MAVDAEVSAFLEDLNENLGNIEAAIAELEDGASTTEALHEMFRAAHTIKGNASMMNLAPMVALGHALETALQEAISGKLVINNDALRLLIEFKTEMAEIGGALRMGREIGDRSIRDMTDRIQVLLLDQGSERQSATINNLESKRVKITLQISKDEQAPSVRAFLVETKLAELGKIIEREPDEAVLDTPAFSASKRQLSFLLQSDVTPTEVLENLNIDLIENINVVLDESIRAQTQPVTSEIKTQIQDPVINSSSNTTTSDTIRLSVKTLDKLLNLTGELIIANNALPEISDSLSHIEGAQSSSVMLIEKNREIFRVAAEIQRLVMKSRMLPIEQVFSRFKRFVRDYAESSGKKINLEISGETTELDKRVIDEIIKPLTHLIRNALDHGIEPPQERIQRGKSAEGTLKIAAVQAGSSIIITVEDDGRGMDLDKILTRAIEKNLVQADAAKTVTPEQIRDFIFLPGFSTKETADDISGRGFGMDIVRDSILKLSGSLGVTSTFTVGTKMSVTLPLTLAIITALTFRIRNDLFALPLGVIEENLRVPVGSVMMIDNHEVVHTRDAIIPFLRLDQLLGYPSVEAERAYAHAIVVNLNGNRVALGIDEFLKKQDLVVKSLAEHYQLVPGIAGAAMLGYDEIVFILDVEQTVRMALPTSSLPVSLPSINDGLPASADTISMNKMEQPESENPEGATKPNFDLGNVDLIRQWISQSNKKAIHGIQMMTGSAEISVKKSRGARINPEKSVAMLDRIRRRANEIYLIHLPMIPATGAIDLILNRKGASRMAELLCEAAGIKCEDNLDLSPLLEITNILGSAYTNSLTFLTQTSVEPATPRLLETASEIEELLAERAKTPVGEYLVIENQFQIQAEDIQVELMIYLSP